MEIIKLLITGLVAGVSAGFFGIGGGLIIEEAGATPERVIGAVRRILTDHRLREMMGRQMRALNCADAAERLTRAIVELAQTRTHTR